MAKITKLSNGGELYESDDGDKEWYLNGKCHRVDGPAIEYYSGRKYWYVNDKLHREDGPAIVYADGNKEWFLNDKQVSQKEFKRLLKLKAFW
jgi:hypothetical protein